MKRTRFTIISITTSAPSPEFDTPPPVSQHLDLDMMPFQGALPMMESQ